MSLSRLTACASVLTLGALSGSAVSAVTDTSYAVHKVAVQDARGKSCHRNLVYALNNRGEYGGELYCHGIAEGFLTIPGRAGLKAIFRAPGGSHIATVVTGLASNGDAAVDAYRRYQTPVKAYIRPYIGSLWRHVSDPHAGRAGTVIRGVNSHGEGVGFYYTGDAPNSPLQAFISTNRGHGHRGRRPRLNYADFNVGKPGAVSTYLSAVNNKGTVAGGWIGADGVSHAFVSDGKKVVDVTLPGAGAKAGDGVFITSLASNGAYAGDVIKNGKATGFVVHGASTSYPSLPAFAKDGYDVRAINRHGAITGEYTDGNGILHGYIARPTN